MPAPTDPLDEILLQRYECKGPAAMRMRYYRDGDDRSPNRLHEYGRKGGATNRSSAYTTIVYDVRTRG